MSATAARWPIPDDVSSLTEPDAHLEAKCDVLIAQAIADFRRTTHLSDGTRSAQMVRWTREFAALSGEGL